MTVYPSTDEVAKRIRWVSLMPMLGTRLCRSLLAPEQFSDDLDCNLNRSSPHSNSFMVWSKLSQDRQEQRKRLVQVVPHSSEGTFKSGTRFIPRLHRKRSHCRRRCSPEVVRLPVSRALSKKHLTAWTGCFISFQPPCLGQIRR